MTAALLADRSAIASSRTRWRAVCVCFLLSDDRGSACRPQCDRLLANALARSACMVLALGCRSFAAGGGAIASQTRWRGVRAWFLLSDAAALLPAAGRSLPRKRAGAG